MNQYAFRLTFFNEAKQEMEKLDNVDSIKNLCTELLKADKAKGYRIMEFFGRKLTPKANKLKPKK